MAINDFHTESATVQGNFPGSTLERFDEAVKTFLCLRGGEVLTTEGKILHVPIIWGTPQRAWSIFNRKDRDTGDKRQVLADQFKRVTLPAISYFRKDIALDDKYLHNPHYKRWVVVPHDNGRDVQVASKYLPILINYQVDFWTKYEQEKVMFMETMLQNFRPQDYLKFGENETLIPVRMPGGMSDISEIEDVGEEERLLRVTLSLEVEGFLPSKPETVRTITSFGVSQGETVRVTVDGCTTVIQIVDIDGTTKQPAPPGVDLIVTDEDFKDLMGGC